MYKYKLKKDVLWYKAGTIFERDSEGQTYITELDGVRYRTLDALQNAICDHRNEEGSEEYFEKVLAQKEDRKECKHNWKLTPDTWGETCFYCGKQRKIKSTPSPLEGKKNKTISQGWACPKCGSVYAIWVSECSRCVNSNIKFTVSSSNTYLK